MKQTKRTHARTYKGSIDRGVRVYSGACFFRIPHSRAGSNCLRYELAVNLLFCRSLSLSNRPITDDADDAEQPVGRSRVLQGSLLRPNFRSRTRGSGFNEIALQIASTRGQLGRGTSSRPLNTERLRPIVCARAGKASAQESAADARLSACRFWDRRGYVGRLRGRKGICSPATRRL